MTLSYDSGDEVRFTGTFTDLSDVATDPANVFVRVREPGQDDVTYEYGVDVALKKSSTGVYYIDLVLSTTGRWEVKFYSTVSGIAAENYYFVVLED